MMRLKWFLRVGTRLLSTLPYESEKLQERGGGQMEAAIIIQPNVNVENASPT